MIATDTGILDRMEAASRVAGHGQSQVANYPPQSCLANAHVSDSGAVIQLTAGMHRLEAPSFLSKKFKFDKTETNQTYGRSYS